MFDLIFYRLLRVFTDFHCKLHINRQVMTQLGSRDGFMDSIHAVFESVGIISLDRIEQTIWYFFQVDKYFRDSRNPFEQYLKYTVDCPLYKAPKQF